jgi:hypothetical protein
MRRKKRSGRPHATANRPGGYANVEVANALPLLNPREISTRVSGWCGAETVDALIPWRRPERGWR